MTASVVDATGLTASAAPGSLPVTRFAWSRRLGSGVSARGTPALARDGTLYVTANAAGNTSGTTDAVSPTGALLWSQPIGGADSSPVLLDPAAGPRRVFVGAGAGIYVLDGSGATVTQCPLPPNSTIEGSAAAFDTGANAGATFYANGAHTLITVRPDLLPHCVQNNAGADLPFPGNLVGDGLNAYAIDSSPTLLQLQFGPQGWQPQGGPHKDPLPHELVASSLVLWSPSKLLGAGTVGAAAMTAGAVFQIDLTGHGQIDFGLPPMGLSGDPAFSPVVGASGEIFVGVTQGGLASGTGAELNVIPGDATKAAPVLGEGARLYAASAEGSVSEWSLSGAVARVWSVPLGSAAFEASPTLDCARDASGQAIAGMPGTLYVLDATALLTAIIVDARGLDVTAPWPKYQKDPRNSGNVGTVLTDFACP